MYKVSETAIIEEDVVLGEGTRVWNHSHIMEGARLGVSCNVGDGVFIGRKVIIGDYVKIANNVNIPEGVIIKNNVFLGSNVSLKNVKYPRAYRKAREYIPTIIEENVTIDVNACLMPGLVIGKGATIGAGAIVVRNVSENGFVVSPPAMCMCEKDTCVECHKRKLQKIAKRLKYEQRK